MADQHRILDFRNRPPLPPYAPIFELKRTSPREPPEAQCPRAVVSLADEERPAVP